MSRIRLRSRFLLVRMAIAAALTTTVILVVRYAYMREAEQRISEELQQCGDRLRLIPGPPDTRAGAALEDALGWVQKARTMCGCDVALLQNGSVLASSLDASRSRELAIQLAETGEAPRSLFEVSLAGESYRISTFGENSGSGDRTVIALRSLKASQKSLTRFTQLMSLLAVLAMAIGFLLVVRLSDTFAKPLGNLVEAVRALEKGDFNYPVVVHSGDELSEVTLAFDQMRSSLKESQKQLLKNERLATIGQMASSISHDLRHPLTAIVANSEFLAEDKLTREQRQNLHEEVTVAVEQMNDLIESLLEFSRGRDSLRPATFDLRELTDRVVRSVRARPEFPSVVVTLDALDLIECRLDPMKLERAIRNLLINACQACEGASRPNVVVSLRKEGADVRIRVQDNGPGVARVVRDTLFQPFVSHGKTDGTGLGLAVVQKICEDHGGKAEMQSSEPGKTIFQLILPCQASDHR